MRFWLTLVLALSLSNTYAHDLKVGYIDVEKIIDSTPQYQHNLEQIDSQFEQTKNELLALFEHINLLKINLEKVDFETDEYNKKLSKLTKLQQYFQQETVSWNEQLNIERVSAIKHIETLINKIIKKHGIDQGFDIIFYQNVAFVSAEIDITQVVINKIKEITQ